MQRCMAGKAAYKTREWQGNSPKIRYERKRIAREPLIQFHGRLLTWPTVLTVEDSASQATNEASTLDRDLASLRSLETGWDGELAPPPNQEVIETVERALGKLFAMGARPTAIRPSVEGGAGICFSQGDAYSHIEFLNDRTIHGLAYSPTKEPEAWTVEDLDKDLPTAWSRILAYLQS